jgi:DMSO/TMAO reductase YedYZ molybdopterin-dependent catalytic subunit
MNNQDLLNEQAYKQARTDELIWQKTRTLGMSRRQTIQLLAAGAGAITTATLPAWHRQSVAQTPEPAGFIKPAPAELFVQHGNNLEIKWENLYNRGYLVPIELFFVRNNNPTPLIDVATWRLQVDGSGVSEPKTFSYDEILAMPSVSVIKAIECAGNGRSFYKVAYGKEASGTQWKLGGIGVAEWTGVPLREILDRCGIKRTARDVLPESLDEKKVSRPISIEKAFAEDTLLVYAMNGQVLPPDHGFPVRVLVPGWVGISSIKWVGRIQVSEQPLYTEWNTEEYVLIGEDYPPEPGSPALGEILTVQKVKSAFELPWDAEIPSGQRLLRGRSWSAQGAIAKVEVSLDGGRTWQEARLRQPNMPQAWVRWDLDWEARPGNYRLQARATDDQGTVQPASVPFNEKGYVYWGIVTHPVKVR